MNKLARLLIILIMIMPLQGCISSGVQNAIDAADEHIRLKWSEEWKPALVSEVSGTIDNAKDEAIRISIEKIENLEELQAEKFKQIQVDPKDFDANKDGKVQGTEALALLHEIKKKNDDNGNPLSWWEIMMLMAGSYLPMTGVKEMAKSKLRKPPVAAV